jgi:hypothetical protein
MSQTNSPQVLIVKTEKNPGLAALLGCLFGPLGLLYSTTTGAVVMFCVNVIAALTVIGLFLTWPACGVWGYVAAKAHNKKLLAGNK